VRKITPGVTLEVCASPSDGLSANSLRVGYTASKKIGGAVVRNQIFLRFDGEETVAGIRGATLLAGKQHAVVLRTRAPHSRAFAAVEHPELDGGAIGNNS
jgi:RNase P protein component